MRDDLLHVIAVVSNPVRYKSRYTLFEKFRKQCTSSNHKLWVVEAAFGDRPFEVTDSCNPNHIQFRSWDEIWLKENMINLAIQRLPSDWQYVAWVDADVTFTRADWAEETVQQLQHFYVVQMFSHAIDLGPQEEPVQTHEGFCYNYVRGIELGRPGPPSGGYYYYQCKTGVNQWHPGYAWAARRDAIDRIGGGIADHGILGAGDHHFAHSLIGNLKQSLPKGLHPNYVSLLDARQTLMEKYITRDIGYVPGTLVHHFHGSKRQRFYKERWKIIIENNFDPVTDVTRDAQGIWKFTRTKPRLRDEIRAYFRARNEDGLEL